MKRLILLLLAATALFGLYVGHDQLVANRPLLPVNLNHQIHGKVNCLTCHHDYSDRSPAPPTGEKTCLLCHKKTEALATRIEQDFHTLCRNCHLQNLQVLHRAGPVRECARCHISVP